MISGPPDLLGAGFRRPVILTLKNSSLRGPSILSISQKPLALEQLQSGQEAQTLRPSLSPRQEIRLGIQIPPAGGPLPLQRFGQEEPGLGTPLTMLTPSGHLRNWPLFPPPYTIATAECTMPTKIPVYKENKSEGKRRTFPHCKTSK